MESNIKYITKFYANLYRKWQLFSQSTTEVLEGKEQKDPIYMLDGVRALACLSVLIYHIDMLGLVVHIWSPAFDNLGAVIGAFALMGDSGVKLFFLLSGFLLFLPYARALLFNDRWPSFPRFYTRRIFRIIPGYYVALFFTLMCMSPEFFQRIHWHDLWIFLTFRMDLPNIYRTPSPVFWSLAIEFQFYLWLPLIALLMRPIVCWGTLSWRLSKLTVCLLLVLAWGMVTRYWGKMLADTHRLDFLFPHTFSDLVRPFIYGDDGKFLEVFAVGMLISVLYVYLRHTSSSVRLKLVIRRLSPLFFIGGLAITFVMALWKFYVIYVNSTLHFLDPYQRFLLNYQDQYIPLGYATGYGLCLFALLQGPQWLKRPFEWAPLRWLGFISYSLYMWHYPFMLYFIWIFLPKFQSLGWSPLTQYILFLFWIALTAVPVSVTLYRRVEMPAIRVGEKLCSLLDSRKKSPRPIVAIAEEAPVMEPVLVSKIER